MTPPSPVLDDRRLGWTALTLSILGTLASLLLLRFEPLGGVSLRRTALVVFALAQLVAIALGRSVRTEPAGKAGVVAGGGQLLASLVLLS